MRRANAPRYWNACGSSVWFGSYACVHRKCSRGSRTTTVLRSLALARWPRHSARHRVTSGPPGPRQSSKGRTRKHRLEVCAVLRVWGDVYGECAPQAGGVFAPGKSEGRDPDNLSEAHAAVQHQSPLEPTPTPEGGPACAVRASGRRARPRTRRIASSVPNHYPQPIEPNAKRGDCSCRHANCRAQCSTCADRG